VTAPNEGAPRAGVEAGTEAQREQKHRDFATAAEVQTDTATAIARALLAGIAIRELPDGSFIATRPGLAVPLPDLAAVLALLRRMSGANV
jgi:hypothetical protein